MQRAKKVVLTVALSALALFGGCKSSPSGGSPVAESSPMAPSSPIAAAQTSKEQVVYLDQGWSQAIREDYYQISQGSAIISYDVFLNLEVANSQELFRSDTNNDRYGLTSQSANPRDQP